MPKQRKRGEFHVSPYIGKIRPFEPKFEVSFYELILPSYFKLQSEAEVKFSYHRHALQLVLLDIGLSDSATFAIRMERFLTIHVEWGTLPVACTDAYHGNRVAIFVKSNDNAKLAVTLIWDFVQDGWCSWWVELDIVDVSDF